MYICSCVTLYCSTIIEMKNLNKQFSMVFQNYSWVVVRLHGLCSNQCSQLLLDMTFNESKWARTGHCNGRPLEETKVTWSHTAHKHVLCSSKSILAILASLEEECALLHYFIFLPICSIPFSILPWDFSTHLHARSICSSRLTCPPACLWKLRELELQKGPMRSWSMCGLCTDGGGILD